MNENIMDVQVFNEISTKIRKDILGLDHRRLVLFF